MDLLFLPMKSVMPVDNNIVDVVNVDNNNVVNDVVNNVDNSALYAKIRSNNKKYLKKFIEKNKDEINKKITCPICFSTYSYFNKSKHFKTKRHLTLLSMNKII